MRRQVRELSLVSLLVLAGCKKDPPAPPAPSPPAAAVEARPAPMESDTYALAITSAGAWKAGAEGAAKITVTAKPPLHVNAEYPVAFKPQGSEAVKFGGDRMPLTASTKVPCAEKAEDTCSAEYPLAATAEKAGAAKVSGVLSFSVCSAEKCLIEKVPLSLAVNVEP